MKPTPISIAILLMSLFVVSSMSAQAPVATDQNAASPATAASAAEVPRLIKFSGTLRDAQEQPLAGPVGVTFALYAQQSGGAALWMETQNVKPDASGNYTVLLGANSANGVPAELFVSGEARWLGIQVGQQPEHERILLVSVPYALKAKDADTVGGLPASAFLLAQPSTSASGAAGATPANGTTTSTKTEGTATKSAAGQTVSAAGPIATNYLPVFTNSTGTLGSSVMYQTGSNIGVGTTTPAVAVDVVGSNAGLRLSGTGTHQVTVTGATSGRLGQDANGFFFASDTNGKSVRFLTNDGTLNEWMRITSAGNVGIGTTSPLRQLEVVDSGSTGLRVQTNTAGGTVASFGGNGDFQIDAPGVPGGRLIVQQSGNVGIGTTTPGAALDVESPQWAVMGNAPANSGCAGVIATLGGPLAGINCSALLAQVQDANDSRPAVRAIATVGIGLAANSQTGTALAAESQTGANIAIFGTNGGLKARIDNTGKGFFDGGTQTGGADFAESVAVRGATYEYEPGDLLAIDQAKGRRLTLSGFAYSTRVAGIYSTKPGVLATPHSMNEPEALASEIPLAVVGIVPCKVTAENGPIAPGDLLVASSKPGHAMKGTNRKRMLGAVVGKALEPLEAGSGVIQVLVTLQ